MNVMKDDRAAARFVKTRLVRLSVAAGRVSRRSLINLREHAQVGHNWLLHAATICYSKSQQNVLNNCINIYEYFQSFLTAFKILQYFRVIPIMVEREAYQLWVYLEPGDIAFFVREKIASLNEILKLLYNQRELKFHFWVSSWSLMSEFLSVM